MRTITHGPVAAWRFSTARQVSQGRYGKWRLQQPSSRFNWRRAWKRREGFTVWLNIPSYVDNMGLQHLQECDPVIESSSQPLYLGCEDLMWICSPCGGVKLIISQTADAPCSVFPASHAEWWWWWRRLWILSTGSKCVFFLTISFLDDHDEKRFGKTVELLNSSPWPSIWECGGEDLIRLNVWPKCTYAWVSDGNQLAANHLWRPLTSQQRHFFHQSYALRIIREAFQHISCRERLPVLAFADRLSNHSFHMKLHLPNIIILKLRKPVTWRQ